MNSFFSENPNLKKLFNLGMHLNNSRNLLSTTQTSFTRIGNHAGILNPVQLLIQMITFVKIFRRLLANGEKITIINTHPLHNDYSWLCDGINIECYEEPWAPGSLTNTILGRQQPSLIIFVSARAEDLRIIATEMKSVPIPVINLSPHPFERVLFNPESSPNRTYIYFYLQLFIYLIVTHQKNNISHSASTVGAKDKDFFFQLIQSEFQTQKSNLKKLKSLSLSCKRKQNFALPVWLKK